MDDREQGSIRPDRRAIWRGLTAVIATTGLAAMGSPRMAQARPAQVVTTGAQALVADGFAALQGLRVGLITNQTGRVGDAHLADLLHAAPQVRLTALLAPEHGLRGSTEAGASVADGRDRTGVPVCSLYGANRAPTAAMLRDVDALVFDIQDIGARFYTYISTMGLAMQAAARRRIPFIVLDRPNPLGGDYVSGFALERPLKSFVGMYPIPIVHGMTVGELAGMIKGRRWLADLDALDLRVVRCAGWQRAMRWPETGLPWVATSPNIPSFAAALSYPGIGVVGETAMNEGRGTGLPFSQFGAPWLDAPKLASELAQARLPGVLFEPTRYTPQPLPGIALNPRFAGEKINAVSLRVTSVSGYLPMEVGVHALALLQRQALFRGEPLLPARLNMFHAIAGTRRLHRLLDEGATGEAIVSSWQREVAEFRSMRRDYLVY